MASTDAEFATTDDPLSDIPPLSTTTVTSDPDKVAAIKLVADSIAQQRQTAARAIIFHPVIIALYLGAVAVVLQFLYKEASDIGILATTLAGITMTLLVAVRGVSSGYLTLAEELKWSFLQNEDAEEDLIIGTHYGDELIGALILRLERNDVAKRGRNKNAKSGGSGLVRAWTVRIKYRGKGIGTALLEEAVKVTRINLGKDAEIGFAAEHANSKLILPNDFNGTFKKNEVRAARALRDVVGQADALKRRRGS